MKYKIIALLCTKGSRNFEKTFESIHSQKRKLDDVIISTEVKQNQTYSNSFKNGLGRNTQQALIKIYMNYLKYDGEIFIATIDDDDVWTNSWIQNAESYIIQGYNFISGQMMVKDDFENIKEIRKPIENPNIDTYLYGNDGVQGSNKVFSLRIALESGGMFMNINSSTDRCLNINILNHPEVKYKTIKSISTIYYDKKLDSERITLSNKKRDELKKFYKTFWNNVSIDEITKINERHNKLHNIREVITWK